MALAADGAAIIDVGGESTRPGATRIDARVESARVLPVIKELAGQGLTVSIDTMHADVAQAALENGAQIVNDVSGGRADTNMAAVVALMAPLPAAGVCPEVLTFLAALGFLTARPPLSLLMVRSLADGASGGAGPAPSRAPGQQAGATTFPPIGGRVPHRGVSRGRGRPGRR